MFYTDSISAKKTAALCNKRKWFLDCSISIYSMLINYKYALLMFVMWFYRETFFFLCVKNVNNMNDSTWLYLVTHKVRNIFYHLNHLFFVLQSIIMFITCALCFTSNCVLLLILYLFILHGQQMLIIKPLGQTAAYNKHLFSLL